MTLLPLQNKTAFITGASSGIGEAAAITLAKAGANLILCARRLDRLEKLSDKIKQLTADHPRKINIHYFQLDVRNKEKVQQLSSVDFNHDDIDILINNAGLARGFSKLYEGNILDWEEMIDTNLKGLLYMTRRILPSMVKNNRGHIVNISSIAGRETYPNGNVYSATKHAVHALSQNLRLDLYGTAIRVSLVSPGLVETEFSEVRFRGDKERAKQPYQGIQPLTAQDIADAILYCVAAPVHVNVSEIFLTPAAQAGVSLIHRLNQP